MNDAKSEIRNSKSETNPNPKIQMTKICALVGFRFGILIFEFVSYFVLRTSSFGLILPLRKARAQLPSRSGAANRRPSLRACAARPAGNAESRLPYRQASHKPGRDKHACGQRRPL